MEGASMPIVIFLILWVALVIFILTRGCKPSKSVIKKYGQPLEHFSTCRCWKTLPIRGGTNVEMDFYSEFIVISEFCTEIVLNKSFKGFKFYKSLLYSVFEVERQTGTLQMCITRKQEKLLRDFFDFEE